MSDEMKWSEAEIDELCDGMAAIGFGSTAAAIKQLQQQLAAAREALQAAEAETERVRESLETANEQIAEVGATKDSFAEMLNVARQFLRSDKWGTYWYMEGSEVYTDLSECAEAIDATLQRDRQP